MGGFGSGQWHRYGSKRLTEETLCLDINLLARRRLLTTEPHYLQWRCGDRIIAAEVFVGESVTDPMLFLRRHGDDLGGIRVESTRQRLGGVRRWLLCCLCGCRCAKLYLPAGEVNWGCRSCHNLSYRSSREAHQAERLRLSALRTLRSIAE